jgi:hypothetical protein
MEEKDDGHVWRLYVFHGAQVVWQRRRHRGVYRALEEPRDNLQRKCQHNQVASFLVLGCSWRAVFLVTYVVEFLFLSAAHVMDLDRMSVFAAPQGSRLQTRWALAGRFVMAVIVLGNAVGLSANAAAAVHYHKAAQAITTASVYYAANNTKDGVVFVTFVLRAACSTMYSVAFQVRDTVTESCPGVCDKSMDELHARVPYHDCACIVAGCS